jgi:hypothetical protein
MFGQTLSDQPAQPKVSVRTKLRRLDLHPHPDRVREYVSSLGDNLRNEAGDWKKTEQVMRQSALKTLSPAEEPAERSWLSTAARSELRQLYRKQSDLSRMLRCNSKLSGEELWKVKSDRKKVRRDMKRCVKRHKDKFRMHLAATVVKGEKLQQAQAAFGLLVKGYDLAGVERKSVKAPILPQVFAAHFEQLFSKTSKKEKLGLMEAKVGPKSEVMKELSGAPSYEEVRKAVAKLSAGKAPGRNRLAPELYKMGGPVLARRLVKDFAVLWPKVEDGVDVAESSPQMECAKVSESENLI